LRRLIIEKQIKIIKETLLADDNYSEELIKVENKLPNTNSYRGFDRLKLGELSWHK